MALVYVLSVTFQPIVERHFGLYVPIQGPTATGWIYLGAVVAAGIAIGFIPAWKAYRNTLSDGLSVRL